MREGNQRKIGVIIHYINMIIDIGIAVFFTPFLIRSLGDAEYGLYRIVQSFAGQLGIMSFGVATLVSRNVVKYNTLSKEQEKENFLAMAAAITVILAASVLVVGYALSFGIDSLFANSLTKAEISLAHRLYWILIFRIVATIVTDYFNGIISAHEKFAIIHGLTTFRYVFRVLILVILIKLNYGSISIVLTDLALGVITLIVSVCIASFGLKEKPHFYYLDRDELKSSLLFSLAIFLQAVINQVNQNLDSVILGALTTTSIVTMYSLALNLFTSFNSISSVIGSVFVPKATRMLVNNASGEELTDLVIKPGRIQLMIGSMVITGFVIFGKEFLHYWVGDSYYGAYLVSIILMVPALIPVIQNVTNAILDAMLKRLGKSLILTIMALLNVGVSILLVKKVGYIGAAIGTALSYIIGNGILMNIYLAKVTTINLKRMYKELLSNIVAIAIVCMVIFYPLGQLFREKSLIILTFKIIVYSFFYLLAMYKFCMRPYEKDLVMQPIKKILGKARG